MNQRDRDSRMLDGVMHDVRTNGPRTQAYEGRMRALEALAGDVLDILAECGPDSAMDQRSKGESCRETRDRIRDAALKRGFAEEIGERRRRFS